MKHQERVPWGIRNTRLSRYDIEKHQWHVLGQLPHPTMDHRELVNYKDSRVTIGGMLNDQQVTNHVHAIELVR